MPRTWEGPRYDGNIVRRARKEYHCDEAYGWPDFKRCGRRIAIGCAYVEGDVDPYRAGGFAHERICLPCARGERPESGDRTP